MPDHEVLFLLLNLGLAFYNVGTIFAMALVLPW